ncbi:MULTISPECIES: hypothetical protein [unclassified Streptomyces]|uniref:hypothetical protein n=1 Tax=unclassified Streptomyces TaxID=2593676 RepID=UPI000F6C8B18|nr:MULTISPECIES: hypothetical protein [unclassified Streptomyces]AZM62213.1 hypothetical protein DLM49_24185 [Streptomyces sp. WAC 01438]RSN00132.1 hypothetical protein DMA10_05215 [Streptomyces sp. WAC 01420]
MRKFQKAAVVAAMLGSAGFLGAGVSYAGDNPGFELNSEQTTTCALDQSIQSLVAIDDINAGVGALLGLGNAENSETNAVACSSNLG